MNLNGRAEGIRYEQCGFSKVPALRYPWTEITPMKGDPEVLKKLGEAEKLLKDLRKALK
jgi:hypothetical protein